MPSRSGQSSATVCRRLSLFFFPLSKTRATSFPLHTTFPLLSFLQLNRLFLAYLSTRTCLQRLHSRTPTKPCSRTTCTRPLCCLLTDHGTATRQLSTTPIPQQTNFSTSTDTFEPSITIHETSIMAPKKIRCNAKDCREAAQRIVGDCGFCNGHFCGKHRLLEDHKCSGLEDCKKQSHERNAAQLESERTQVIRGV